MFEPGLLAGKRILFDGGQQLRSSGGEDLLQWSPTQWAQLRASRRAPGA